MMLFFVNQIFLTMEILIMFKTLKAISRQFRKLNHKAWGSLGI